ncbi:hypothetical protein CA2015_1301 [Cyclobacterium amurskyense]|uniref:Uncharacterized protein n=1 Tax=Cyclobacterium amurskyense TaxID=320787 RepID=A0A0H4PD34_9BACT|nr:hypothetical protein CA2015_1301 [Cyclobacterium amurskyense]
MLRTFLGDLVCWVFKALILFVFNGLKKTTSVAKFRLMDLSIENLPIVALLKCMKLFNS